MGDNYGTIAGIIPATTEEVELWACPAGSQLVSGIVHICNQDTQEQSYDLFLNGVVGVTGNCPLVSSGLNTIAGGPQQVGGLSLKSGQSIRVKSGAAGKISFVLMGLEVTSA